MDEPPFALSMRLALPASIIAKGGSFSTVSTLRLYSSTSLACGFLYEIKKGAVAQPPKKKDRSKSPKRLFFFLLHHKSDPHSPFDSVFAAVGIAFSQ